MLRFGGWRSALTRAGLPANPRSGPQRTFEFEDAVDAIALAWRELAKVPTVAAYDAWRARRSDYPSAPTIRHHIEGWADIQLAAWPLVHGRELPDLDTQPHEGSGAEAGSSTVSFGATYREASEEVALEDGDPFERDPQQLERSLRSHATLQNRLAAIASERGLVPLSPSDVDPNFDLAVRHESGVVTLIEVKSAKPSNLKGQLRLGLGQILRYSEALIRRGYIVQPVLVIELRPPAPEWETLLQRLGVRLVTPNNLELAFTD